MLDPLAPVQDCLAVSPTGLICELRDSHTHWRRNIVHDFSGRVGKCRVCGISRHQSPHKDCKPYPPTPHAHTTRWED